MRRKLYAPVITVAIVMGACGSAAPKASGPPRHWTEPQVVKVAGLARNPDLTYRLVAHPACIAPTMLRSPAEVQSYKAAGDQVVTNPDGSVGLKVSGDSPACQRLFTQALAKLR